MMAVVVGLLSLLESVVVLTELLQVWPLGHQALLTSGGECFIFSCPSVILQETSLTTAMEWLDRRAGPETNRPYS